ncbi:MAG TPA: hypothetical protein VF114_00790 [Candidatus Limnocylindria bacterium]
MTLRRAGGILLALALVACSDPNPTSSLGPVATATPGTSSSAAPAAGQPYDGATILRAMQASTRPGGVAGELQTDATAAAVADQIWTWDGRPWDTLAVGGACGGAECSLDVAGSTEGMAGADLYTFTVNLHGGNVMLEATDLHAYPAELDVELDAMARAAAGDALGELAFVSARWLPPPDEGRYWLAYRTGGEEGSPGLDLLLDAASGQVVERRQV